MSLSIFGYAVLQNGDKISFIGKNATINNTDVCTIDAIHHIANTASVVKLSDGDLCESECDWCINTNTRQTSANDITQANNFVKFYTDLF